MNMNHFDKKLKKAGFTLIELLVVITVITILLFIFIPNYHDTMSFAREKTHAQNKLIINTQVERYYFDKGIWPEDDLNDIGQSIEYFPSGLPVNPVDPSIKYTLDPATHRVNTP